MSDTAISVENISKQYRLGVGSGKYGSLRDSLMRSMNWVIGSSTSRMGIGAKRHDSPATFWALKDISFALQRSEVLGIIGNNGAGKSTILKILSEITEPTLGRIVVGGRVASLLEVGTGFHPELTGRENIYLNGAILGMQRREIVRKFDEIVAFAEVERFLDTQVKHYSSGMYMRLAFSVAAHLEPEILVIDEVLAVGDIAFQKKCLGKMEDVSHSGKTVLFVSHNMDSIRRLCTTGLLLERGTVSQYGPIDSVVDTYLKCVHSGSGQQNHNTEVDASAFYIRAIDILDINGQPKNAVATWDSVRFRITYHAPRAIRSASVCFQLASRSGSILSLTSTQPDRTLLVDMHEGINIIDCVFPCLALSSGSYTMGAGIAIPYVEMLCDVLDGWDLEVLPADVYSSGLAPSSNRYLVALDHSWEIS